LKKPSERLCAEFVDGSWGFACGSPEGRIRFDQAIIDATFVGDGVVEGFVKSVYGVDAEVVKYLTTKVKKDMGIMGVHVLGVPNRYRVRLMPDGRVERMDGYGG
jgi:hypothetical protein